MLDANELADSGGRVVGRRVFLFASGAAAAALVIWRYTGLGLAEASASHPKLVTVVDFTDAGVRKGSVSLPVVEKSETEWKKQLSHDSFEVTRHADTEQPFTGALLEVHENGVFRCICCDTALYSSETKFESGTGWPSFWGPIAKENIVQIFDNSFGMARTAISCRRCEAHLGHLFDDGPRPTGLRFCMNSVAMRFAKAAEA